MKTKLVGLWGLLLLAMTEMVPAQYIYVTNVDGTNTITITGYAGTGGSVSIPSSLDGQTVTAIGEYAFDENTTVTNVTIPPGVTVIEDFAFYSCYNMEGVSIPSSVTNIGAFAFEDTALTTAVIPGAVVNIGNSAFEFCYGLTNLTLTPGIQNIGQSVFSSCASLSSVVIPATVSSVGLGAFQNCANLTNATINNGVAFIGPNAFAGTRLASVNLPASVTNLGVGALSAIQQLKTIAVDAKNSYYSSFNGILFDKNQSTLIAYPSGAGGTCVVPAGVTCIGDYAFYGCSGLTNVTLPGSITNIGSWAFSGCGGLINVTIPGLVAALGEYAFSSCTSLSAVNFQGNAPTADTSVFANDNFATVYFLPCANGWGSAFAGLTTFLSPAGAFSYAINSNVVTLTGYYAPCGELSIPSTYVGLPVTSIGGNAFYLCPNLTNVTVPATVTNIAAAAFDGCTNLSNVTFLGNAPVASSNSFINVTNATAYYLPCTSGWDSNYCGIPTVITAEGQFNYATNGSAIEITGYAGACGEVVIPNSIGGLPVKWIATNAFYFRTNMTSVLIPGSVLTIGANAFQFCTSLTNVTMENGLMNIGDSAFDSCFSLTDIVIPNSVTNIGNTAFQSCFQLASVTIPGSVISIGSSAFGSCLNLAGIAIPSSVNSIGDEAFYNCMSLKSVTIAANITNINIGVFYGCSSLANVTIPGSVTSLGDEAFYDCTSLAGVFFQGNAPVASSNVFYGDKRAIVYCASATLGWTNTYAGVQSVLWNPLIEVDPGTGFGVTNNQFGFSVSGTANIPIAVEACVDLGSGNWNTLTNVNLTNGSFYFGDPGWSNFGNRFYRISPP